MTIPWEDIGRTVGPIIGSVAGGIIDKQSQDAANKANAQNVDKQINFQKEQNATQYQRAVTDMRAAGLNPALAYKQGGNQSGSGAAAENRAVTHGQRLTQAVDAYNSFANGTAQRELLRQQTAATSAQARKTSVEANALQPDAAAGQDTEYIDRYVRGKRARAQADIFMAENTPKQFETNIMNTRQGTATAKQQADLMSTQATLNEQQFMNEWYRKNIAPYINSSAHAAAAGEKIMESSMGTVRGARGLKYQLKPF